MKILIVVGLLLSTCFSLKASYREHREFKPAEISKIATDIVASFDLDPGLEGISFFTSRRFLPRKWTGQEVRITRKKNGSLDLKFSLAFEQRTKGHINSDFTSRREEHLFSFLPIKGAKLSWHLDHKLQLEIARLTNNISPMAGFTMEISNKTIFEVASGKALKSTKEVSINIWQDKAAIDFIELYFSKNPKEDLLWEDD